MLPDKTGTMNYPRKADIENLKKNKKFYNHSPPSADSRRAVASYWQKYVHKYWLTAHSVLVHLFGNGDEFRVILEKLRAKIPTLGKVVLCIYDISINTNVIIKTIPV